MFQKHGYKNILPVCFTGSLSRRVADQCALSKNKHDVAPAHFYLHCTRCLDPERPPSTVGLRARRLVGIFERASQSTCLQTTGCHFLTFITFPSELTTSVTLANKLSVFINNLKTKNQFSLFFVCVKDFSLTKLLKHPVHIIRNTQSDDLNLRSIRNICTFLLYPDGDQKTFLLL